MLSLLDLRARISAGTLTPAGAIDLCRAAIAAREPELHALVTRDAAPAIPETGPLAGIAVGVKDIIDSAGLPSQMGSAIYAGWMPRGDAAVVDPPRRRTRHLEIRRPGELRVGPPGGRGGRCEERAVCVAVTTSAPCGLRSGGCERRRTDPRLGRSCNSNICSLYSVHGHHRRALPLRW